MYFEKSWFQLKHNLPNIEVDDDTAVRFPITLPQRFIKQLTRRGNVVLDPFAGFGTTLFAAQKLSRVGIGVECEAKRVDFVRTRLRPPSRILHGDARKLAMFDVPPCDLCFTSPPYMRSFDVEDPLTNYRGAGDYQKYLRGIRDVFRQVKKQMKPAAYVCVEVENTYEPHRPMTPLAWDVGQLLAKLFFLEQEMICCQKEGNLHTKKVNHSTILILKNS